MKEICDCILSVVIKTKLDAVIYIGVYQKCHPVLIVGVIFHYKTGIFKHHPHHLHPKKQKKGINIWTRVIKLIKTPKWVINTHWFCQKWTSSKSKYHRAAPPNLLITKCLVAYSLQNTFYPLVGILLLLDVLTVNCNMPLPPLHLQFYCKTTDFSMPNVLTSSSPSKSSSPSPSPAKPKAATKNTWTKYVSSFNIFMQIAHTALSWSNNLSIYGYVSLPDHSPIFSLHQLRN